MSKKEPFDFAKKGTTLAAAIFLGHSSWNSNWGLISLKGTVGPGGVKQSIECPSNLCV